MLASKYRLKSRLCFNLVQEKGKIYQFPSFGIAVYERGDTKDSLVGIIVSTKISKLAVIRNKIKRSISESVRNNYIYLKKGCDIVFLVKSGSLSKSTDLLMKETKEGLEKSNLLK